jgi:predicted ArsR family transcriptional regulator
MDVTALAAAVGLHVTTARGHLAMLERAGLVLRTQEVSGEPGRPRQLYALADESQPQEGHRRLAEFLASVLAADAEGGERAEEAGRRWAQAQLPDAEPLSWDAGTRRIVDLFDALGFAPETVDEQHHRRIDLRACPFRDVARAYPGIVCAVHRGLLKESLARMGQPGAAAGAFLEPFVEPELCVAGIPMPEAGPPSGNDSPS